MCQTLFTDKNEGKLTSVPKSSGPLLGRMPLNIVSVLLSDCFHCLENGLIITNLEIASVLTIQVVSTISIFWL